MKGIKKGKLKIPFLEIEFDRQLSKNEKKVSWELFCELSTRIGVVEFVEEEDLIINCLKSWYSLFSIIRERIKKLYPFELQDKKNKILSTILINLLNKHLRPFLRKWHEVFRFYWEKESNQELNPISRQKKFPQYKELVTDLKEMQTKLFEITEALKKIANS